MKQSIYLAILFSMALAACGSGPASSGWTGMVTDSAGIMIIQNPTTGLWSVGEELTLAEVLRIGQVEGAPKYQFGEISTINVDPEGQIYVGDRQAREIRVYTPAGEYLRSIGRPGAGPGELGGGGTSVLFGGGDTLFVPDPGQQRVNLFLRDGAFVRSFPIPMSKGVSMKWAVTPDHDLLQHIRILPMPGMETDPVPDLILRRGSDGVIRDTVLAFSAGESVQYRGGMPEMKIFAPAPTWELADDGRIFFAVNSDFRIEVRTLDGGLTGVIEKPFVRQSVTEADRTVLLDFISGTMAGPGMPPAALQMIMQGISFADYYPAFSTTMAGPEGSLWIQRVLSAERAADGDDFSLEEMGAREWDVFDRDGRLLGVVTLPARFRPSRFHANRLYGVLKDELDVSYAVALELSGGIGGT